MSAQRSRMSSIRAEFSGRARLRRVSDVALPVDAPSEVGSTAQPATDATAASPAVRPNLTLWLLSAAHAVNHAQAALLPLVYLAIITEFRISVAAIAFLTALG